MKTFIMTIVSLAITKTNQTSRFRKMLNLFCFVYISVIKIQLHHINKNINLQEILRIHYNFLLKRSIYPPLIQLLIYTILIMRTYIDHN